jgi:hypothetical protein
MSLNYLLSREDYTIYNALTFHNGLHHYHKAYAPKLSCTQSLFHKIVAFVEFIPVISQIASLFEMAIAYLLIPSFADLTQKDIKPIKQPAPSDVQPLGKVHQKREESNPPPPMSHSATDTKEKAASAASPSTGATSVSFISPSDEVIRAARIQMDKLTDLYNKMDLLNSSQGQNLVDEIEAFRVSFEKYRDPQPDSFKITDMVKIFTIFDEIAANTASIQAEFKRWSEFFKIQPNSDGVIPMPKDGNCWAHSAVIGLEHTNIANRTHEALRAEVVQWMREHYETDEFLSQSIADAIEAHKYFEEERIEIEKNNLNIMCRDFEAVLNTPKANEQEKAHAAEQIIDIASRLEDCSRLKETLKNFNTELYLNHMTQLGSHGGRAELYTISQIFKVNVAIWREFSATEDLPIRLSKDFDQQIPLNPAAEHTINVVITREGNHFNFRIQGSGLLS